VAIFPYIQRCYPRRRPAGFTVRRSELDSEPCCFPRDAARGCLISARPCRRATFFFILPPASCSDLRLDPPRHGPLYAITKWGAFPEEAPDSPEPTARPRRIPPAPPANGGCELPPAQVAGDSIFLRRGQNLA